MRADYVNGLPNVVRTYNVAIYDVSQAYDVEPLFTQGNREQGYYIQDKWTPTRKLVINYGLRFESNYGWQDATCQPVTVFFTTGRCFDAIKGAPDLKNVLPRFAVVYDVTGDGRTALKFAANRYDQPIQMEFVGRLNPVGAVSDQRQWLPQIPLQRSRPCVDAIGTAISCRRSTSSALRAGSRSDRRRGMPTT